ncbi:MAG: tyrosine recombinase XerC [Lysinibacillus sp.]
MTITYPKFMRDFFIYLTTIKGKSQRTRKEYEYDLTLLARFLLALDQDIPLHNLNDIDISTLTIDQVREWTLEDLYFFLQYCETERGNSPATRARKVSTLRTFFGYLKTKRRLIDDNIAEQLETPKIGKRTPVYMTIDETTTFIHQIDKQTHSARDYCMMTFLLHLGLRVSELCALNIDSLQGRRLSVVGKGDKERIVYLNDTCMQALESYLVERKTFNGVGSEPLFISQKGSRFARQTVARLVKRINGRAASTKKITPHKLRHTSATLMYKAGVDIRSLQAILGHTSVATTQIYTHIEDDQIQEAINKNPLNNIIM